MSRTAPVGGPPRGPGGEELWVIAKTDKGEAVEAPVPGSGSLMAIGVKEKTVPLPLKHTDVKAWISGYIATVEVTQQYHNPYDGKIEAVYVFPLPHNAAVNEFLMTIGDRRIRGIIREREEAERIYEEAKRQGYVASLLTQERPNIFTQKVANIEPGKDIDINIKYFSTLAYDDGWYEFVFPMVVGPRFNPPGSTEGVGAVARGKPGARIGLAGTRGQKTEVQYLRPNERSGHDISLTVDLNAGVSIEDLTVPSHVTKTERPSAEKAVVTLSPNDTIPNKDFVLRYKVAGDAVKSSLLTHRDERGGYFTLMLYPPEDLKSLARAPVEFIFVLDCSGSMNGVPIAQAKKAVERGLKHLEPGDSFQLISFSINASQMGDKPLEATAKNVQRGLKYLASLEGEGGTMMIEGIKAALDFPHDPERLRVVVFLTDGYIGNESEILGEVRKRLGASRIFSFGVGSSVNRYLLDGMAKIGQGVVAYVSLDGNAGEVMDAFFARLSHPALADVTVDWGGMGVTDTFPRRVPDLFVGRPVIVTGRFEGEGRQTVRVRGKVGGSQKVIEVPVDLASTGTHKGLPSVWARMKIADLYDQATYDPKADLPGEVKQVALEYGLMSAYTAFVAVDSTRRTEGDSGTTVQVPVPVPAGVRYDTTVQEEPSAKAGRKLSERNDP